MASWRTQTPYRERIGHSRDGAKPASARAVPSGHLSRCPGLPTAHALTRLHTVSTTRRAAILSIGCPVVTHQ
jgi:hypothetical protein